MHVRGVEVERLAGASGRSRRGGPPSTRRSSMISPSTTATAPRETSWSWKPVSLPFVHVITQTSTWSSRQSCSKWRSAVAWRTSARHVSGSAAMRRTSSRSSSRSRSRWRRSGSRTLMRRPPWRGAQQPRRVARAQRGLDRVAERELGGPRRRGGRSRDELVDADLAQHRVDGPLAVGGDVEEDAGIARGRAAAGDQPLAVQRRQAGEHREAHAQARVRGPAPDARRRTTPTASRPRSR